VRHGATAWSASGQHTGLTDLDLSPQGEAEARGLGPRLPRPWDQVLCSDRLRAIRTAELAGYPDAVPSPLLREVDYGRYEGLTTAEIWAQDPSWEVFSSGCPGGESPAQVMERCRRFLIQLPKSGRVLIFSHGHISRALAAEFVNLGAPLAARLALSTASMSHLVWSERGPLIQSWNLTA